MEAIDSFARPTHYTLRRRTHWDVEHAHEGIEELAMTPLPRRVVLLAPIAMLFGASLDRAEAQASDYPNRPVSFIVPFAPGGVTSLFARVLGQKLEQRLGKPFIVENRPGGGGVTAAAAVAQAQADGYTIMMASSTVLAINVTMRKSLPYDPRKDLTPIALLARVPFVLVVNPALPIQSVADLVKLAKEKPGQIAFGTPGPGTFHHLNGEMFKGIFGLDLVHVPYKGSAPALNDLVGGHIQMMFCDVPPAMSLIQAGKIRALGVTTRERVPAVADIPPLAEVGVPGYDTASWHTVTTTANVPKAVVDKLYGHIREIMADPSVTEALVRDGAIPQVSPSPDEMRTFVEREIVRWGKVIEQAGLAGSE
jgi:tripartite-type tricarboxylate transporter receptor subunit TctC